MFSGIIKRSIFVFAIFAFSSISLYGYELERLNEDGLEGAKPLCISLDNDTLWVGTDKGLFSKDQKEGPWRKLVPEDGSEQYVKQVIFPVYSTIGLIVTSKGLYELDSRRQRLRKIYSASRDDENDCAAASIDADQNIYVATKAGVMRRAGKSRRWEKCGSLIGEKHVDHVYAAGKVIYCSAEGDLYRSQDSGKAWEKIFNLNVNGESSSEGDGESGEVSDRINKIISPKGMTSKVYLTTSRGGFVSEDSGNSWNFLPVTGLGSRNLIGLEISVAGDLYVFSRTGIFRLTPEGWSLLAPIFDVRGIAITDGDILAAAVSGIYTLTEKTDHEDQSLKEDDGPTIQEVQKMVIEYCDLSNDKISGWHKQSRAKAFLPDLSFGYGNNVYGSYNGLFAVGPNDWQVNVSWDLADLVYSSEQTSIDARSRMNVQLRNDVLAEATQLFFERKKLLSELRKSQNPASSKSIRVQELNALLDRLTGGTFSKVLKSGKSI